MGHRKNVFHGITPALYLLWWGFYWLSLKYVCIHNAWISIMEKQNSNQNVKVEKMAVLVKTFDHYHYKFQLFQLSYESVKEFETIQFSEKKSPGGKT